MTLHEKIEEYVETADTAMASDLLEELATLAWETNTDPSSVESLRAAGITQADLAAAHA